MHHHSPTARTILFVATTIASIAIGGAWLRAQDRVLTGYSPANSQTELDWERKIQAIPQPENIKANMMELAAEPHHLGSERQRQLSLWLQTRLRGTLSRVVARFDQNGVQWGASLQDTPKSAPIWRCQAIS